MKIRIGVTRLAHAEDLPLPAYASEEAAGLDLRAAVPEEAPLVLGSGKRALVPTGLVLEIPAGFEGQIRPRSGLALKHGISCLNSPGTIDSDYRGEVGIILINHGEHDFLIERGMRIAQLVIAPIVRAELVPVAGTGNTDRGAGGFGSTGHD